MEENKANKATETQYKKMKAIVRTKYGSSDALQLKEVEKPTPTDNGVLVKVHASSINKSDLYLLRHPFLVSLIGGRLLKPKRKISELT